jgi:hypothetical protein
VSINYDFGWYLEVLSYTFMRYSVVPRLGRHPLARHTTKPRRRILTTLFHMYGMASPEGEVANKNDDHARKPTSKPQC